MAVAFEVNSLQSGFSGSLDKPSCHEHRWGGNQSHCIYKLPESEPSVVI